MRAHRVLFSVTQKAHVLQCSERVALEILQELLRYRTGNRLLIVLVSKHLVDSLLQVSSVDLVVTATLASLNALGLHQHSFSVLLVASVMLGEHRVLVLLNDLNTGLL